MNAIGDATSIQTFDSPLAASSAAAQTIRRWLTAKALPLWSTEGFDHERGCFEERLTRGGQPVLGTPRRAMVQARQIYVFSHAAHLGWFPKGLQIAETAMESLQRDFRDGAEGFAFSVDADGKTVSLARDAYTHAFVLFAIAWLYRVNGDARLLQTADETTRFIETSLVDPVYGGVFDEFPVKDRNKRQNPHMHLLEAFLALEESAPGRGYIDRARSLVEIFKVRLFSPDAGVLLEYFAEDWGAHPDTAKSCVWEPGHQYEWAWLLREYEKLTGEDLQFWIERLYLSARAYGSAESLLLFDEVATDMTVLKRSNRIWPHTEAAKAAVALYSAGDRKAPEFGAAMISSLMEHFLDRPFEGGWIDHLDHRGHPLVDYVPASSLYHLFLAATEMNRAFPADAGGSA
ncbi:AGE family epimerase/isomerase [Methylocapsa palsarum]|nr:AGE family epimerase/isomerase [Methylocapsa palsarum]